MQITINGEPHTLDADGLSITELLQRLNVDVTQVAVEKNLEIIPKSRYEQESVAAGDAIELVEFVGGG